MADIVIADDDLEIRRGLERELVEAGHQVRLAADGREALHRIRERRPDAVVVDDMMPRMDGFDVLQALRREPATEKLPVMLLTAQSANPDVYRDMWGTYEDALPKSVRPSELRARLYWMLRTGRAAPVVLVADDEAAVRRQIGSALAEQGLRVDTARDGEEALRRIRRYVPNLVVLDLIMPFLDGFEVMSRLRADPSTATMPLVVLSSRSADGTIFRGWMDETGDCLAKPVETDEVTRVVIARLSAETDAAASGRRRYPFASGAKKEHL